MISSKKGILLFGDSVFFGIGASHRNHGCGRLLKQKLDSPVVIKSRNRVTTHDALRQLTESAFDFATFKLCVVMFGNNDCRLIGVNQTEVRLEDYQRNLQGILAWFRTKNINPILLNLQPIDSRIFLDHLPDEQRTFVLKTQELTGENPYTWQKAYSDACFAIAKTEGCSFIDIRRALEYRESEVLAEDGLHPNDEGHRMIAEEISSFLSEHYR